jgi:3-oxoadipate enol-lactonase
MPFAEIGGFRMHYQVDGPREAPPLLLSNSLGTNLEMWLPQIGRWARRRCVIRYDARGHLRSQTASPPYTIAAMAYDALALLDLLKIDKVDFCGLSMGGMIGMWIAIHHADRLSKLIVANSAPAIGSPEIWNNRIEAVLTDGMDAVAAQAPSRWFTAAFCGAYPQIVSTAEQTLRKIDPRGYAHCCEAIRDADLQSELKDISVSTLIISGEQDPVIPLEKRESLSAAIAGSKHVVLPAAHLSNIEQADKFTNAVLEFLD